MHFAILTIGMIKIICKNIISISQLTMLIFLNAVLL